MARNISSATGPVEAGLQIGEHHSLPNSSCRSVKMVRCAPRCSKARQTMRYQRSRKHRFQSHQLGLLCGMLLLLVLLNSTTTAPMANASILPVGPCPYTSPGSQGPPCDATGIAAGTLLASLSAPFTSSLGTTAGTMISAVYRESGGTLDFYYQVSVNTTASNCGHTGQNACDAIGRETDTDYSGLVCQDTKRANLKV